MNYLLVSICVLLLVTVEAHLRRILPQPPFPGTVPIQDPFWTGANMFRGGMNHALQPLGVGNNFGQWSHTQWGTPNVWNSGLSQTGNEWNTLNGNGITSNDPWEQYRKFNSGMRTLSGMNQGQVNAVNTNIVPGNQLVPGLANNNNNLWNSFATQGFNRNIPSLTNGVNQGFVTPGQNPQGFVTPGQFQQNLNVNNQFQNQGFPNTFPLQNRAFI